MRLQKILKTAIIYLGIGLGLSSIAGAEQPNTNKLSLGYNALENAATSQNTARTRALTSITLTSEKAAITYEGLNQADNLKPSTYMGRQVLLAGKPNGKIQAGLTAWTTKQGFSRVKPGIRNSGLIEKLRGYGYIDAGFNRKEAELALFYGLPIKSTSIELTGFLTYPFGEKPSVYTELQLNQSLGKTLSGFARAEILGKDVKHGVYLAGLTIKK